MEVFLWLALVLFLLLYPRVIHNSQLKPKVVESRGLAKRLTDTVISAGDAIFVYALIVTTSLVNLITTLYRGRSKSSTEPQHSLRNIERLLSSAVTGSTSTTTPNKDSQLEVLWAVDNARIKHRGDTGDVPCSNDSLSDFWDQSVPQTSRDKWLSWLLSCLKSRKTALKEKSDEAAREYQSLLKPTHETKLPRAVNTFTNYTLTVEMGDARSKTTSHGDTKSPSVRKSSRSPARRDIDMKSCKPHRVASKSVASSATQRSGDAVESVLRNKLNMTKARTSVAAVPVATEHATIATQTAPETGTTISTQTSSCGQPKAPNITIATQTRPYFVVRPARTSLATQTSVTALSHIATQTKSEHYMTTATQTRFRSIKPPRAHVGTQTRPEPHYNRGIQTLPYRPQKPPHRTAAVQTTISQNSIAVQTCASFPSLTNASSVTAMNTEVSTTLITTESDEDVSSSFPVQPQYTSTGCQTYSEGENILSPRTVPDTTTTGTQTLVETETPKVLDYSPLHLEEPNDAKRESDPMGIPRGTEKARSYRKKFTQSLAVPQEEKTPIVDSQPPAETPKATAQQTSDKQPRTVHYVSKVTTEYNSSCLQRGLPDTRTNAANNACGGKDNQDIGVQAIIDSRSEYRVMERIRMLECRLRLADVRCQRWSERMSKAEEIVETLQNQVCVLNTTLKDLKSSETRSVKCVKTVEQQVQVSLKDLKSMDMRSMDTRRIMDMGSMDSRPMEDISEVFTKTTFAQQIQVKPTDSTDVNISLNEFLPPQPTSGPVSLPVLGPLPTPRIDHTFFNNPPAFSKELSTLIKELRREMETQLEETSMKYRISNISVESFETAESSVVNKYPTLKEERTPRSLLRSDTISAEEQIIKITMNEVSDSSVSCRSPSKKIEPCKSSRTDHSKKEIEKDSPECSKKYKKLVQKLDIDKLLYLEKKSNDSESSAAGTSERHRRVAEKNESHKTSRKVRKKDSTASTTKGENAQYRGSIEKNESTARKTLTTGRDSNPSNPSNSTATAAVAAAAAAMAADSEFSRLPTPGGTGDAAPFHSIQVSPVSSEEDTSFSSNSDESGGQRRFVVAKASSSSTTRRLQTGPVKVLNLDSKSATNYILTCYEEDV